MTKILALTDTPENLVRPVHLPGNPDDTVGVAPLISGIAFGSLLADKANDSNWSAEDMRKQRHLVENYFRKLSEFKRAAFRSDKTDDSFRAMVYLTASVVRLRSNSTDLSARARYRCAF